MRIRPDNHRDVPVQDSSGAIVLRSPTVSRTMLKFQVKDLSVPSGSRTMNLITSPASTLTNFVVAPIKTFRS